MVVVEGGDVRVAGEGGTREAIVAEGQLGSLGQQLFVTTVEACHTLKSE